MKIKHNITAATSDYIKIGNRVLPMNAAGYDDANYNTITNKAKQAYEADKRAEDQQAAKSKALKAAQDAYNKCMSNFDFDADVETQYDYLAEQLIPNSGRADTFAGELLRAFQRIEYRYYNDGDYFWKGYGLETCGSSAAYLIENAPSQISKIVESMPTHDIKDSEYENKLHNICEEIVSYIADNIEAFMPNEDDSRTWESRWIDDWEEESSNLEFEVDTSGLEEYVDDDIISWNDVETMIDELTGTYGGSLNAWARDGFTITGLTEDQYEEWDHMWPKELNSYIEDLEQQREDGEDWEEDED